ncbi:protein phosphatase 2C domain-containing protein [Gemmata sp. JC717]|uniref:PP2C family protein-serine/threonine phosphatase n=1 Tax=Gemmata algarum TaxID=2975278 RepID=UPI0021BAFEEA|nr:protein phosphatase 2C domain-containing protein [Gemmata algarum]MDY3553217.1 protein phosphatase 2C domain-containing protein [Gemmata algarum]
MAFTLNIGKCSLLGNYRENNEDCVDVKVFPDLIVNIVADGMGGQAAGEIASRKAVDIIPRELRKNVTQHLNPEGVKSTVRRAIVQANEEIMAMGALDKDMKNMGTTVVMAVWRKEKGKDHELFVAGVGDSRCYLVRNRRITQLTVDHSLAQALVEARTISPAEAKDHRFRNVLWKYLGSKEVGEGPDVAVVQLQTGDRLLLCTDGLTGVVSDEDLAAYITNATDMQQCAEGLGQLALDQNSRDNVSCVVIDVAEA